ncbi:hypothetical protein LTR56_007957 [Elasticomyces elasticus]|nr:hypothetical protein LTR56_007957 [Elasticomyces elasticus]KAK3649075.1 hypothetical protein LTR22_013045 [Elasticomyces elasticus]KAK4908490.1 hypothetical protein LTR49_022637 [Elasticomyces elasticus]KAK5748203.1 hypothetical protein LTS12_021727 [Elasticomyces elasticus]
MAQRKITKESSVSEVDCLSVVRDTDWSANYQSDDFWVLESDIKTHVSYVHDDGKEFIACPVEERRVSKEVWLESHEAHARYIKHGFYKVRHLKVHGRRINDEVELFLMEDGKETPGLRKDLEEKGLTVRLYVPQADKKKYPSPSAKTQPEMSPIDRCIAALKTNIAENEIETDRPTPYALLGDAGMNWETRRKKVLVLIVQESRFKDFFAPPQSEHFTSRGCDYEVFGTYSDDEVHWRCTDEEFISFFQESRGYYVECMYCDNAKAAEEREQEQERKERKAAKKLRQQQQQQLATGSQTNSFSALEDQPDAEDEAAEARAEAKRAKEKAKRKAQQARKKAKDEEAETLAADETRKPSTFLLTSRPKKKHNPSSVPRIFGSAGQDDEAAGDESDAEDVDEEGAVCSLQYYGDNIEDMINVIQAAQGERVKIKNLN